MTVSQIICALTLLAQKHPLAADAEVTLTVYNDSPYEEYTTPNSTFVSDALCTSIKIGHQICTLSNEPPTADADPDLTTQGSSEAGSPQPQSQPPLQ